MDKHMGEVAAREIVGIRCNAGLALLSSGSDTTTPCPLCLVSRLAEAGFEPDPVPITLSAKRIPSCVLNNLTAASGWAQVILVRGHSASVHALLPFPNCPGCAPRQGALEPRVPLSRAVLRDPLTGITSCRETQHPRDNPQYLCCGVTARVHVPLSAEPEFSEGTGTNLRLAATAQLGETVERYCAFHPVVSRLVRARIIDLGKNAPAPRLLCGYSARQLQATGYRIPETHDELSWLEGRSLLTGEPAMVPAASVYLHRAWADEVRYGPMISTGTVCCSSPARGLVRAMLEVIERHCVVASWNRVQFGQILPSNVLRPSHNDMLDRIEANRLNLVLRALTPPPRVPVALASVAGERFPWITFGSAAAFSIGMAARKAAEEAAHAWQVLIEWKGKIPTRSQIAPVAAPYHHMLLSATRARRDRLLTLITSHSSRSRIDLRSVKPSAIRKELLGLCPEAVAVDLTSPDCILCDLRVIKVVAPGLPTLAFGTAGAPFVHLTRHQIPSSRDLHPFG